MDASKVSTKPWVWSYPDNPRVWKSLIVARLTGVQDPFDVKTELKWGETNKTKEFLGVNPFGQVPTLFVNEKEGVFESNSIARYFARVGQQKNNLYGANALEASRIDAFIDASLSWDSAVAPWLYTIMGYRKDTPKEVMENSKNDFKKRLVGLNTQLENKKFLVGDKLSLADICCWCSLFWPFFKAIDAEMIADVPHLVRWFKELKDHPDFKAVTGEKEIPAFAAKKAQREWTDAERGRQGSD